MVLGWLINTRRMLFCLPRDKYLAYLKDIEEILSKGGLINLKQLESMIGKLQHSSYVTLPLSNHFLGSLRRRVSKVNKANGNHFFAKFKRFCLSDEELADLVLWKDFLKQAHKGISLNGITLRKPCLLYTSPSPRDS